MKRGPWNRCYLRTDGTAGMRRCDSVAEAVREFTNLAKAAYRIDCHHRLRATIHIAARQSEVTDDADYLLRVGPRGGVIVERVP